MTRPIWDILPNTGARSYSTFSLILQSNQRPDGDDCILRPVVVCFCIRFRKDELLAGFQLRDRARENPRQICQGTEFRRTIEVRERALNT
jgi:hypothetical protein